MLKTLRMLRFGPCVKNMAKEATSPDLIYLVLPGHTPQYYGPAVSQGPTKGIPASSGSLLLKE